MTSGIYPGFIRNFSGDDLEVSNDLAGGCCRPDFTNEDLQVHVLRLNLVLRFAASSRLRSKWPSP
jgi:hypothetical protein